MIKYIYYFKYDLDSSRVNRVAVKTLLFSCNLKSKNI